MRGNDYMKPKVAIIGGGYTGLSCAKKLIDNDFDVTIFEKTEKIRRNDKMY